LTATKECHDNYAAAVARWPEAKPAFSGTLAGNGEWLVLANDGHHFNRIRIEVQLGGVSHQAPTQVTSGINGSSAVQNVLAQYVSGSGRLNLSGWACGWYPYWSGYVQITTWYLTYLELDVSGYLKYCNYAETQHETPYVSGAGSWTYSDGIIGNGSSRTNPWINWYGSNILLCCSETVYERFYMDDWGNWSYWASA